MLIEQMLKDAVWRAENRQYYDTPFEVKNLFTGDEWNQLTGGEKRRFGQLFAKKVDSGEVLNVCRTENANNRHNRYIRIRITQE